MNTDDNKNYDGSDREYSTVSIQPNLSKNRRLWIVVGSLFLCATVGTFLYALLKSKIAVSNQLSEKTGLTMPISPTNNPYNDSEKGNSTGVTNTINQISPVSNQAQSQ